MSIEYFVMLNDGFDRRSWWIWKSFYYEYVHSYYTKIIELAGWISYTLFLVMIETYTFGDGSLWVSPLGIPKGKAWWSGRLKLLSCKALKEFKYLHWSSVWIAKLVRALVRKTIGRGFESLFSHFVWPRGIKVSDQPVECNG